MVAGTQALCVDNLMHSFRFVAQDLSDTDRLGRALAECLPETATLALEGTLGAGKTRLVQALASGCEIEPGTVTSPTFVLCQPHRGTRILYHLDAYRIQDLGEFLELGVEEYFEGPGLTVIEWADRVAAGLPDDFLQIRIDVTGATQRCFELIAHGAGSQRVVACVAQDLAPPA